jgi:hypothetical protein
MKDANQTILYTKETREVLQPTLHLQSTQSSRAAEQQSSRAAEQQSSRAAEQQSSRALCRSRDTSLCCLAVGRSERRGFLDLLPEASLPLAVILLAGNTHH